MGLVVARGNVVIRTEILGMTDITDRGTGLLVLRNDVCGCVV